MAVLSNCGKRTWIAAKFHTECDIPPLLGIHLHLNAVFAAAEQEEHVGGGTHLRLPQLSVREHMPR
jgi:hypothetical protein